MNDFYGFCTPIPNITGGEVTTKMATGQTFALQVFAHWCGHCGEASPLIQQASCALTDIPFFKLDADTDLGPLLVESLPTLILFKGGVEAGRIEGLQEDAATYVKLLNLLLAGQPLPPEYLDDGEDDEEEEDE